MLLRRLGGQQLPHHGLQDAAVAVVVEFDGRVDAECGLERFGRAVRGRRANRDFAARLQVVAQAGIS